MAFTHEQDLGILLALNAFAAMLVLFVGWIKLKFEERADRRQQVARVVIEKKQKQLKPPHPFVEWLRWLFEATVNTKNRYFCPLVDFGGAFDDMLEESPNGDGQLEGGLH